MSPRHFHNYSKNSPQDYKVFSDNLWNGFVSITKYVPIANRFFSFTPEILEPRLGQEVGRFSEADLNNLNPRQIGRELGKVYKEALPDTKPL
jgi:hypothetical protein